MARQLSEGTNLRLSEFPTEEITDHLTSLGWQCVDQRSVKSPGRVTRRRHYSYGYELRDFPPHTLAARLSTIGWKCTEPPLTVQVPEEYKEVIAFLCTDLADPDAVKASIRGLTRSNGLENVASLHDIEWIWELLVLDANPYQARLFGRVTYKRVADQAQTFGFPYVASHKPACRLGPDPDHPLMVLARQVRPSHKDSRA